MTSSLELKFREPGYPVFKGFIVPYRVGGEVIDAKRLEERDIETFREVLYRMREFVSECLNERMESGQLDPADKLDFIADSIVLFLRIPLIREPIASVAPTPMKIYMLYHLGKFDENPLQDPCEFAEKFYGRVCGKGGPEYIRELRPFKIISDERLSEKLEKCWFYLPADTRPGPNITNLFAHLTLTSAISWALAVERGLDRLSVAKLRLAAMLHDLGKPFDYRHHVEASRKVAEWLLRDLLTEPELSQVIDFIAKHHVDSDTKEGNILRDADRIASSIDRLGRLSEELLSVRLSELSSELGLNHKHAYESGSPSWEFWSRLEKARPASIEELTKTFIRSLRERLDNFTRSLGVDSRRQRYEELKICLVDLGGIQNFITRFTDLRCVEAASLIVDLLIMAQIPLIIHRKVLELGQWYPVEAILYAAGGVVEYLMPRKFSDGIKKELRKFNEKYAGEYPQVRVTDVEFSDNYPLLRRELEERMRREKIVSEAGGVSIHVDSSLTGTEVERKRLCKVCFRRPVAEKSERLCESCQKLYSLGTNIHFKIRYESEAMGVKPEDSFGAKWEEISKYVVELISGHDKHEIGEKLKGGRVEWRDLAVVKVDGNLMGAFMASALSMADAYERSVRVDLALKKSFERALREVREAVSAIADENEARKTLHSIFLGLLYMGGDDSLILCPAWIAPVISAVMGREFALDMGGCRGLGIGVAVGKCRASVWSLIDAANALMKKAKEAARDNPATSMICFDIADGGELTGISAEASLEIMRSQFLTIQPLSISSFTSLLGEVLCDSSSASFKDLASECYLLSRFEHLQTLKAPFERIRDAKDEAKRLLSAAREALAQAYNAISRLPVSNDKDYLRSILFKVAELYSRRQVSRLSKEGRSEAEKKAAKAFQRICKLLMIRDREGRVPYSDVEKILKISGGGAL